MPSLREWLDKQLEREASLWIKRLSASDTLAMGDGEVGPKIPGDLARRFLPELQDYPQATRQAEFIVEVASNDDNSAVRATLYPQKVSLRSDGTQVLTVDWGGAGNALLEPENTGALAVLAFRPPADDSPSTCVVWVCANLDQEGIVESDWGPIEPGVEVLFSPSGEESRQFNW